MMRLLAARPTAVNLRWALDYRPRRDRAGRRRELRAASAFAAADRLHAEDIAHQRHHGPPRRRARPRDLRRRRGRSGPVNILTHCNTGWIACVDWGTALGVVYAGA